MAALCLAFVVFLAAVAFEGTECLIVMCFPAFVQQLADRFGSSLWYLDYAELPLFVGMALVWFALVGLALAGSMRPMPLLHGLSQKPWFVRFSFAANVVLLALIPISLAFGFWATALTRTCVHDAKVYFLYDEGIAVPRWGYAMGLSRLSLQAERN